MQVLKYKIGKVSGLALGAFLGGFWGMLLGLVLGAVIDAIHRDGGRIWLERKAAKYNDATQQDDFIVSTLLLTAVVVKSDGRVDELELSYVRAFLAEQFGTEELGNYWMLLQQTLKQEFDLKKTCRNIRLRCSYETRLQLIYLLFGVANADYKLDEKEIATLKVMSIHLGIQAIEFNSIQAMYELSVDANYRVLGLTPACSDAALKAAYRAACQQFHPDKLHNLGMAVEAAGKAKFIRVKEAYEAIKKDRGI